MKDLLTIVIAFGFLLGVDRLVTAAVDRFKRRRRPRRSVYVFVPVDPPPPTVFHPSAFILQPSPQMPPPRFEISEAELAALEAHFRPQPGKRGEA